MSSDTKIVILGAALAGASAAETLRSEGFDGEIRLVGAEPHRPYIRPPLSKEYLSGKEGIDSASVHPEGWYRDHDVDLMTSIAAVGIDRADRTVTLADGRAFAYDRLLLATGSSPRRLSVPGAGLDGVHHLRTMDDSEALRAALKDGGRRVAVIGSGWIGMEVAATARTLGNEVTVLEHGTIPLAKALGAELGAMFAELHEENGVVLRTSVEVEGITGEGGRASGVLLRGGDTVPADVVVAGLGATPNVDLAVAAGLEVENGILVDAALRTSDERIFAAGDVANAFHPVVGRRLRSEHWANALNGGRAAARSMLGQEVSFDDIPYFYTDQFDLGMEYSGYPPLADGARVVYRGDRAGREFVAFWLADGRVVAGMNVNVWDVNEEVQALIRRGTPVDVARLTDESVPFGEV